jgi:hypothetical protein
LAAGGAWWMARSARAALAALYLSHVPFRRRWKLPKLNACRVQVWRCACH